MQNRGEPLHSYCYCTYAELDHTQNTHFNGELASGITQENRICLQANRDSSDP